MWCFHPLYEEIQRQARRGAVLVDGLVAPVGEHDGTEDLFSDKKRFGGITELFDWRSGPITSRECVGTTVVASRRGRARPVPAPGRWPSRMVAGVSDRRRGVHVLGKRAAHVGYLRVYSCGCGSARSRDDELLFGANRKLSRSGCGAMPRGAGHGGCRTRGVPGLGPRCFCRRTSTSIGQ